jgi:lipopolysaccharide export system permease protein
MQVTDFNTNVLLVRDVSNRLDLEANDGVRGDREMSTCEMMEVVRSAEREVTKAEVLRRFATEQDLHALLGLPVAAATPVVPRPRLPAYCMIFAQLARKLGTAKADSTAQSSLEDVPLSDQEETDVPSMVALKGVTALPPAPPGTRRPRALTNWGEISTALDEIKTSSARADQYRVEVHKKWAISVACLVFALVGIPMALRFPRGGMGLVIGGGLFVFAIYYIGLIAGEGLGNKDIIHPWIAMWAPDIIFAALAVVGIVRVSRESGSTRGGDLTELWETITSRFRRRPKVA